VKIHPATKQLNCLVVGCFYYVEFEAYDDFGKPMAVKGAGAGKVIGVG